MQPLWTCAKQSINLVASKKPEDEHFNMYLVSHFADLFLRPSGIRPNSSAPAYVQHSTPASADELRIVQVQKGRLVNARFKCGLGWSVLKLQRSVDGVRSDRFLCYSMAFTGLNCALFW